MPNNTFRTIQTNFLEGIQSSRNYIPNSSAENNSTNGWALGTTGTLTNAIPTGSPIFGSGASGNLSVSASSSSPISGTYSLSLASSAATTAGNMLHTDAITIDNADQAKVLTFSLYFSVPSNPTNGNFSGTSSNSFGIAAYDVTNTSWLPVAGNFSMTQNSGIGIATGTMQTNATTSTIRFCIYNANATSGAITVNFDRIQLGPITAPIGPVVTDWVSYTPTVTYGSGGATNVTSVGKYRRVGDSIQIQGSMVFSGASSAFSAPNFTLPSGLTFDTSKFSNSANFGQSIGYGQVDDSGNTSYPAITVRTTTSSSFNFYCIGSTQTHTGTAPLIGSNVSNTFPFTFGASDSITFFLEAPISGWGSNVQMSNDTDTRVVAARFNTSTARTVNNTSPTMIYETLVYDTHGAYNASNGNYTIPVTGKYSVQGYGLLTSTSYSINNGFTLSIYKNGSNVSSICGERANTTSATNLEAGGATEIDCNAGDVLTFRCYCDASTTLIASAPTSNFISLSRLSGPSVIAATESVNARYYASATSISGSLATVSWTTKDYDSHNAMSSGTYTIPVSGKYSVTALVSSTGTHTLNSISDIVIQKNGVTVSESAQYAGAAITAFANLISDIISCNAGDTIRIQYADTGTGPAIVASNTKNYISISRVGN